MNKLLYGRNKGKRGWFNAPGQSTFNQFTSAKSISNPLGVQKHTNRRITVLNKLFMKNITDLMATGTMAEEIVGRGIEISRVKVAPDFQNINIYWLAKGSEDDQALESLLRRCSGLLRHELSQLRVMGEVPRMHFVKDLEFAKYVEVERILKEADMGGDECDLDEEEAVSEPIRTLPEMRNDVLGLNHSAILRRIQEKLKISKVAWDQYKSSTDSKPETEAPSLSVVWESRKLEDADREERFQQYLNKKRFGKERNAGSRADRQFLLDQHITAGDNEEYQDWDDEVDVLEEEFPVDK